MSVSTAERKEKTKKYKTQVTDWDLKAASFLHVIVYLSKGQI